MAFTEKDRADLDFALRHDCKHFGPELAKTAYERGLAVTNKVSGETTPIPVTATPVIIDKTALAQRQHVAALLASAGVKMSRAILAGPLRSVVFDGLSPLEQRLADATFQRLSTLVTTRVDFFVNHAGEAKALELNATIPAMQAYSDIAAHTFIEIVGRFWGAKDHVTARWQAENGSNALALFRALLNGYAQVRDGRSPERLLILTRKNDAQRTELNALASRFSDWGVPTTIATPDQLSGTDAVRVDGQPFDLIYRHLFVRRLEEVDMVGADYVRALLAEPNGTRAVVLNPPASQVEVKAVFAYLSEATEDAELAKAAALTTDELEAIRRTVPWTRVFRGPALLAEVQRDADHFVIKRSWDYGGRAVFVGKSRETPSFTDRAKQAYGAELDWAEVCTRAEADRVGGGFVVQRLVETSTQPHVVCSGNAQIPTDLFVDFSTYASVGPGHAASVGRRVSWLRLAHREHRGWWRRVAVDHRRRGRQLARRLPRLRALSLAGLAALRLRAASAVAMRRTCSLNANSVTRLQATHWQRHLRPPLWPASTGGWWAASR